jgi:hypothetical protein
MPESYSDHKSEYYAKEVKKIFEAAIKQLALVGLNVEDLVNKNGIVDLGAHDCAIERVCRSLGIENVISVDTKFPSSVKNLELNLLESDAKALDLESGYADLVISRAGPHFKEPTEAGAKQILKEMNRIVSSAGEVRLHPVRFGFIQEKLKKEHPRYDAILATDPFRRSLRDIEELTSFNNKANELTVKFLEEYGYEVKIQSVLEGGNTENVSGDQRIYATFSKKQ